MMEVVAGFSTAAIAGRHCTTESRKPKGPPATQRHVMEAVAACDESRDLWLPVIERYIEDDTRDPEVRRQATTVRQTVGLKSN